MRLTPLLPFLLVTVSLHALGSETAGQAPEKSITVSVALSEGAVEIVSTTGPLKHFREQQAQEQDAFAAFKSQIQQGITRERQAFEAYKEQVQAEFLGYKSQFRLQPGRQIILAGDTATERASARVKPNAAEELLREWRRDLAARP